MSYTRPKTRPIQCTHLHFSAWGSLFCLVAIGQTLCTLSTVCVQRAMVVLPVAQAQYMDAFVKSSNYFSYVLLFCQEANSSLSLSLSEVKSAQRERGNTSYLSFHLTLSLSLSLSLSRYSSFKSQEGKCAGLRF